MFRYRLYSTKGDDLGEAVYAMNIRAGDMIHFGGPAPYLVIDEIHFTEEDSPLTGVLMVSVPERVE